MIHYCKIFSYGDQTLIRPCCATSCFNKAVDAKKHALSNQNSIYREYIEEWNALTNAEMELVKQMLNEIGITEICGYLV